MKRFRMKSNPPPSSELHKPLQVNAKFLRPEKWLIVVLIIVFLYFAQTIIAPFIVGAVLAYIINPIIDMIERRLRWPRALIVGLLYIIVFGVVGSLIYGFYDDITNETQKFIANAPEILQNTLSTLGVGQSSFLGIPLDANTLITRIQSFIQGDGNNNAIQIATTATTYFLDTILCLLTLFYLLIDGGRVGGYLLRFVSGDKEEVVKEVARRIHQLLSAYLRGVIFLMTLVAIVSFLVLKLIFHLEYALPLAIMTGFLEIIPLAGPVVAAAAAASVALFQTHSIVSALWVIFAYLIIRQVEDQLVMPFVVGKIIDIHPLVTIFAILVGSQVSGILGMFLAVPVVVACKVILESAYPSREDVKDDMIPEKSQNATDPLPLANSSQGEERNERVATVASNEVER